MHPKAPPNAYTNALGYGRQEDRTLFTLLRHHVIATTVLRIATHPQTESGSTQLTRLRGIYLCERLELVMSSARLVNARAAECKTVVTKDATGICSKLT